MVCLSEGRLVDVSTMVTPPVSIVGTVFTRNA